MTVDDPGAYTAPWTGGFNLRWEEGTELFEYVCQQANYAPELMVGAAKSVDRTSAIVPKQKTPEANEGKERRTRITLLKRRVSCSSCIHRVLRDEGKLEWLT